MKLTNNLALPQPIVAAIEAQLEQYDRGDSQFSVTDLVNPPQITYLTRLHEDSIIEDASHRIWMLLGSAIHNILEMAGDQAEGEVRLFGMVDTGRAAESVKISGKFDHLALVNGVLTDYKVTSAYAVKGDEVKPEWVKQLNYYRWLCIDNELWTDKLQITAILRDWNRHGLCDESYPRQSVINLDVPVWGMDECQAELYKDVEEHLEAMEGNPRPCTDAERWCVPGKTALMKVGRKSAVKLFDTFSESVKYCAEKKISLFIKGCTDNGKHYLDERPTIYKRCADYCAVSKFCPQLKEEANEI